MSRFFSMGPLHGIGSPYNFDMFRQEHYHTTQNGNRIGYLETHTFAAFVNTTLYDEYGIFRQYIYRVHSDLRLLLENVV